MKHPTLTVVIPAYNEARTIAAVIEAVSVSAFEKQIVVVDDGSDDDTGSIAEAWGRVHGLVAPFLVVTRHATNRGKGAAIRTGLRHARGEVTLIQDADLEYDPEAYPSLVRPILDRETDATYGSRYLSREGRPRWSRHRLCVHLLNTMVYLLYGGRVTDEATCYKVFRTEDLRRMNLRCERFEFCPEVTAKAFRMGLTIREVPVRYRPRSCREGKKIRWWDGVEAVTTLLFWRLARFRPRDRRTIPMRLVHHVDP